VNSTFLVASGDPAELLKAVDGPLDLIALPVRGSVEARVAALIAPGGDDRANTPLSPLIAPGGDEVRTVR
jgi:hypothetical protein